MDKIGCQSLQIMKMTDSGWELYVSLFEFDEDMSSEDTYGHIYANTFESEVGVDYYVLITVFAENETAGTAGRMSTTSPVFEKGWELMEEARFMERTNHLAENLLEIQRERGMKLAEFSRELDVPAEHYLTGLT